MFILWSVLSLTAKDESETGRGNSLFSVWMPPHLFFINQGDHLRISVAQRAAFRHHYSKTLIFGRFHEYRPCRGLLWKIPSVADGRKGTFKTSSSGIRRRATEVSGGLKNKDKKQALSTNQKMVDSLEDLLTTKACSNESGTTHN